MWVICIVISATVLLSNIVPVQAQMVDDIRIKEVGDMAPELKIAQWLKGEPIDSFKKGRVYVLDFWAPYCKPCIEAMPLHSRLAKKYKSDVDFLGVHVYPNRHFPYERTKAIIDSLGKKVNYAIAIQEGNAMELEWIEAFDSKGLPRTFIIDREGRVAWKGYTAEVEHILRQLINNKWDIVGEGAKNAFKRNIRYKDYEADLQLKRFWQSGSYSDFFGEPDSALHFIDKVVQEDPVMDFADHIVFHKFSALLKNNVPEAMQYASKILSADNPLKPAYYSIYSTIKNYENKLTLPPEVFRLGAELMNIDAAENPKNFMKMAEWYWRAGDKQLAIRYQRKAIRAMKKAKTYGKGYFY